MPGSGSSSSSTSSPSQRSCAAQHRRPARTPWRPSSRYPARHNGREPLPRAFLPSHAHACRVRCGEGRGDSKSLTLGLDGTNRRFPWTPSVTMLNYRLANTTECIGIDHDERDQSPPRPAPPTTATSAESSPTMVRRSSRRRTAELRRAPETLHFAASFLRDECTVQVQAQSSCEIDDETFCPTRTNKPFQPADRLCLSDLRWDRCINPHRCSPDGQPNS